MTRATNTSTEVATTCLSICLPNTE